MTTELLALLSFLFLSGLVVVGGHFGRSVLYSISVSFVVLSNLTILIEPELFGGLVTVPWAVIMYSVTYLVLNTLVEKFSTGDAYRLAILNLCGQLLLWVYLWGFLPSQGMSTENSPLYQNLINLFAQSDAVSIAAVVGSIGWFANVFIYDLMRKGAVKAAAKKTREPGGGGIAVRNIVATFAGQLLNTVVFFTILKLWPVGEGETVGPADDEIIRLIVGLILFKWVLAVIATPLLYLCVHFATTPEQELARSAKRGIASTTPPPGQTPPAA